MYSNRVIRWILDNYAELSAGKLPDGIDDYGVKILLGSRQQAPYELARIYLADVDRAMSELNPTQRFVILALGIDNYSVNDCAYWCQKNPDDIAEIERHSINRMVSLLNGRSILPRFNGKQYLSKKQLQERAKRRKNRRR